MRNNGNWIILKNTSMEMIDFTVTCLLCDNSIQHISPMSYLHYFMLLQAVVTAVEHVDNLDRKEAETLFAGGVQYTDEEQEYRLQML